VLYTTLQIPIHVLNVKSAYQLREVQGTNIRMKHNKFNGTQKLTSRGRNKDMIFKRNTFVTKRLISKLLLIQQIVLHSSGNEIVVYRSLT